MYDFSEEVTGMMGKIHQILTDILVNRIFDAYAGVIL